MSTSRTTLTISTPKSPLFVKGMFMFLNTAILHLKELNEKMNKRISMFPSGTDVLLKCTCMWPYESV